jgi:hypothetical protein
MHIDVIAALAVLVTELTRHVLLRRMSERRASWFQRHWNDIVSSPLSHVCSQPITPSPIFAQCRGINIVRWNAVRRLALATNGANEAEFEGGSNA